jgi:hypothetical protein
MKGEGVEQGGSFAAWVIAGLVSAPGYQASLINPAGKPEKIM